MYFILAVPHQQVYTLTQPKEPALILDERCVDARFLAPPQLWSHVGRVNAKPGCM
ncbi:unnamed protein product, partial [Nesidiocoris tenuis]